jgi:Ca2+-binding RTX toxin-like protein
VPIFDVPRWEVCKEDQEMTTVSSTRSVWITNSYMDDVVFVLKVAENAKLRLYGVNPALPGASAEGLTVTDDGKRNAVIGYGYDLFQNATTALADLAAVGATIPNPAALTTALGALAANSQSKAQIAAVNAAVSLPNEATAAALLQISVNRLDRTFTTFLSGNGLPNLSNTNMRVALFDMWYQSNSYFMTRATPTTPSIPTRLTNDLIAGNRAEAWYEIRYGSAAHKDGPGVIWRRYMDAQLFGLFEDPQNPTPPEVLAAYEMLTAHRNTILVYEAQSGVDPHANSQSPTGTKIGAANDTYGVTGSANQVQTLLQVFGPAETAYLATLRQEESSDPIALAALGSLQIAGLNPVDVFVSQNVAQTLDASSSLARLSVGAPALLVGMASGQTLIGAGANELLIGDSDAQVLRAGATGVETLVGGASGLGQDTLVGNGQGDVLDVQVRSGASNVIDSVVENSSTSADVLYLNGLPLGTGMARLTDDTWTDDRGNTYFFTTSTDPNDPKPVDYTGPMGGAVGELRIFVGTTSNQIDIWGFNLATAETTGFDGIKLPQDIHVTAGSNIGFDPPGPAFDAGGSQTYTVWLDAPTDTAQTVTMTLSGVPNTADFSYNSGSGLQTVGSNGEFTVAIAAGRSSATFELVNRVDLGGNSTIELTPSLLDPNDQAVLATGEAVTENYVEPSTNPFVDPTTSHTLTSSGGVSWPAPGGDGERYVGDGSNDVITTDNVGFYNLVEGGDGDDVITDSAGLDVIQSGNGNSVVVLNGYADLVFAGDGNNRVYGGTEVTDPSAAVAAANAVTSGGDPGALISAGDGDNTIVGGSGDGLITTGLGDNLIIAGSGNETVVGGVQFGEAQIIDWSVAVGTTVSPDGLSQTFELVASDVSWTSLPVSSPGMASDTIFGGAGNDYFQLSDGNNEVECGTGSSTIIAGSGDNTIRGGTGPVVAVGGSGSDYISAQSGNDYFEGGGGNNTLMGGSGNDTLLAGNGGADFATSESGNNYVDGGAGNDLILGSGGNDTLIGGAGNDQIEAGAGNEYISGGPGNDSIFGGAGHDTIIADGGGADVIHVGTGDTTVYGGSGADSIWGGGGNDLIYTGDGGTMAAPTQVVAGSGNTTIYGGSGADNIFGGAGSDVIYAGDGGTTGALTQIVVGSGDTTVFGGLGTDSIWGGSGRNVLYAGDGGSFANPTDVFAGTGQTTIYGGEGSALLTDSVGGADLLVAGGGDDTLIGTGADTLVAGTGDAYMAGAGNCTYLFHSDFGQVEIGATSGTVTLEFASDVDPADLSLTAELTATGLASLVIDGPQGSIQVDGGLAPNAISSITFDDPQTLTLTQLIQAQSAAGSAFGTQIAGANGDLIFDVADGDAIVAGSGADTISAWGNGDTLTAGSGGDLIYAEGNNDLVYGGAGFDTLDALGAGTTLVGGTGSTLFEVNDTTDVVQVGTSHGSDTIAASVSYTLATNVDVLTLVGTENLTGTGNADASNVITANAGNDTLVAGSGNDTLVGGAGNNRLVAGSGNDLLRSGSGVDTLVAGSGTALMDGNAGDTYLFNSGFGHDEIDQLSGTGTVQFGDGIVAGDLTVGLVETGGGPPALTIQDGSGSITIDGGLGASISGFAFSDGSTLSLSQLLTQAHVESSTIAGANGNLIFNGDAGASIVGGLGNDTIYAYGANDTVEAGAGNQQLFGENAGDILIGGTGSDSLYGGLGNDIFVGGTGSTAMYGGQGNDSYMLTQGATATIFAGSNPGEEVIYLPQGMTLSEFSAYEDRAGDLVLESLSSDTTLVVNGFYNAGSSNKNWILASDDDAPQLLGQWAAAQNQPAASYTDEINRARGAFAAQLLGQLQDLGAQRYTLGLRTDSEWDVYHFNGISIDNIAVQNGALTVDSSEQLDVQSVVTTVEETSTISTPIYGTETVSGSSHFVLAGDIGDPSGFPSDFPLTAVYGPPGSANDPTDPTAAALVGYNIASPSTTRVVQTGVTQTTVTVPVQTRVTTANQTFVDYNITGDGGNDVILGGSPAVGTLKTGDGDVYADFSFNGAFEGAAGATGFSRGSPEFQLYFRYVLPGNEASSPGMFMQAGSGNDTLIGTGGADAMAAGSGFDYMEGWMGTTYYVPMQGDSTDIIGDLAEPYGEGPFPLNTLVLPTGVTPQNLQYRVFDDMGTGAKVLQLTYGDSTVLVYFKSGAPYEAGNNTDNASAGVNLFQFADGTVLTRDQLIAQATLLPNDFNPTVTALNPDVAANAGIAASSLFSVSDGNDDAVTWYQISNTGAGGGHFVLNGTALQAGASFKVNAEQFSQLQYVAGSAGASDQIIVSAFDRAVWSTAVTFDITPTDPVGTTYEYDTEGRLLSRDAHNVDGSSLLDTFAYNADGSYVQTSVWTPADGSGATTTVYDYDSAGELTEQDTNNPDGSTQRSTFDYHADGSYEQTSVWTPADGGAATTTISEFDSAGQLTSQNIANPDGSTDDTTFAYHADGSSSRTEVTTAADGSGATTALMDFDAQGRMTSSDMTDPTGATDNTTFVYNSDGTRSTTEVQTAAGAVVSTTTVDVYDAQGRSTSVDITNPDGSTDNTVFTYNADGTTAQTEITTPVDGGATTRLIDGDSQGRWTESDIANPDGSFDNMTFAYNADGSHETTEVSGPAGGSPIKTEVYEYDTLGRLTRDTVDSTNSDGSTSHAVSTNSADGSGEYSLVVTPVGGGVPDTTLIDSDTQGRWTLADHTHSDGSTDNFTRVYAQDGSFLQTEVGAPGDGSAVTTIVQQMSAGGDQLSENAYTLQTDGSYTDFWSKPDGSGGSYWWNTPTLEYQQSGTDSNGTSWVDDYQYAAGGDPGGSGHSYTETYSASDGSSGTRQYDASTGVTSLTWDSTATGMLSGTTSDSGFIGLQADAGLTNTQPDLSYFNPSVSPNFNAFLAGH